jgi:hypothetical protein
VFKEFDFTEKRPSITTIRSRINQAIKAGATTIHVTWGENQIRLEKLKQWIGPLGPWSGEGWIGGNGGDDIAHAINKQLKESQHAHD